MQQFDPALHEELAEGPDDEEVDVVLRLRQPGVVPEGVRVVAQFGDVVTARVRRGDIIEVHDRDEVESIKASEPLHPADGIDEDDDDDVTPRPSDARAPSTDPASGRGVVVAVLDWFFRPRAPSISGR